MTTDRTEIRLALPSKGVLAEDALALLANAGLRVHKPNPRQYRATIPSLPGLTVLFQRAGDIVVSVRDGSVDFGITGRDVVAEQGGENGRVLLLQPELGFGSCTLNAIVPESWEEVRRMADLGRKQAGLGHPLRVVTRFPKLTRAFFDRHGLADAQLISAEGTLEIAPSIGYADLIVDLVSTGTTLRDNRLRALDDGLILRSQACLIANRPALQERPEVLALARQLLEFIVAYLRAVDNVSIFANVRGDSPEAIAGRVLTQSVIGGLQGPTISRVFAREGGDWYAVNVVIRKDQLAQAIAELRAIGGSGVVVTPVTFIFEEEPPAYQRMLAALEE
ncbi:MAG: ATP phosphoribosyltransferase [Chloroflexi bacterium]|nr:ATP phosphoribosyltransferase [Chloroflexota bacterium]MCI0646348.1 ATP phosphoribosyltransferase [Chloroflexota bacterium]MCI0728394.1 ATP phosphoribosyltransferase [Chloroflexota bacterium]